MHNVPSADGEDLVSNTSSGLQSNVPLEQKYNNTYLLISYSRRLLTDAWQQIPPLTNDASDWSVKVARRR